MSMRSFTNLQDSAAYKIIDRYKKLIIAFLLIVFLFVIGEFTVETFLTLGQVLLTLKLASFIALFALCQMVAIWRRSRPFLPPPSWTVRIRISGSLYSPH
jgi:hypothetical protein